MDGIEYVAKIDASCTFAAGLAQRVESLAMPFFWKIEDGCYWLAKVAPCNSSHVVYHEEVSESSTLPSSFAVRV
jgi:hypothetical protein